MTNLARKLNYFAWALSGLVIALAVIVVGQDYRWNVTGLSAYQWFPLFGLLAFSLMWVHYIIAALRVKLGIDKEATVLYFESTSLVVLILILLHPGVLAWKLWQVGAGLPPGSYLNYVGQSLRLTIVGGMIALLIFLAYELRRKYSEASWWHWLQKASDVAMIMIFFHGLRLGSQLQSGWFQKVWYVYGLTLALAILFIYAQKGKRETKA